METDHFTSSSSFAVNARRVGWTCLTVALALLLPGDTNTSLDIRPPGMKVCSASPTESNLYGGSARESQTRRHCYP